MIQLKIEKLLLNFISIYLESKSISTKILFESFCVYTGHEPKVSCTLSKQSSFFFFFKSSVFLWITSMKVALYFRSQVNACLTYMGPGFNSQYWKKKKKGQARKTKQIILETISITKIRMMIKIYYRWLLRGGR